MFWAFGSGIAVGLVLALAVGVWLLPALMELVNKVVEQTSLAVKFPGSKDLSPPFVLPSTQDVFADLERDTERVPSWMGNDEDEAEVG